MYSAGDFKTAGTVRGRMPGYGKTVSENAESVERRRYFCYTVAVGFQTAGKAHAAGRQNVFRQQAEYKQDTGSIR